MNKIKLLLPRTLVNFKEDTDIVFFLAGPIRGGGDWQKDAIKRLNKFAESVPETQNVYVVCPCRYTPDTLGRELYDLKERGLSFLSYSSDQEKLVESQTNWERYHLEIASRLGCVIFWLAKEDAENPRKKEDGPYARDTYGELGEWRTRVYYERKYNQQKLHVVIGSHSDFPGGEVVRKNFEAMRSTPFSDSLEETIFRSCWEHASGRVKKET